MSFPPVVLKLILAVFLLMQPGLSFAQEVVGVVERIAGQASRTGAEGTAPLALGSPIHRQEGIRTTTGSRLLIRFIDNSTLTLGEEAQIHIDDLVYSREAGATQSQRIDIFRGVFGFVSGEVGQLARQNVLLRTPVATIGIRGTEFVGGELTVGMPAGRPHYGFQIRRGAIEVAGPGGSVVLDEPGEGTFLPLFGSPPPTSVRQWTPDEAAEADAALAF